MAYEVRTKQKERADDRSLNIDGIVYPPRRYTVGVDRELAPLIYAVDDALEEIAEHARAAAGVDEKGARLEKQPTKEQRAEATNRAQQAGEKAMRARCELIAAALDKSETGEAITAADLLEHLEVEDIIAFQKVLIGAEPLPDRPTGDSDAA